MFDRLNPNKQRLHNVAEADVADLERHLFEFITTREPDLYSLVAYQMGWKTSTGELDERPLPQRFVAQIVLSAAKSLGRAKNAVVKAAAVELLHNFLEVHGDVQTGNTERHGRPSLWWEWGPAQAINTGDGINALARLALIQGLRDADAALVAETQVFDDATLQICQGLYSEIEYQEGLFVTVDEYLNMLRLCRGVLVACALKLGAMGGAGELDLAILGEYGEFIGVAHGIQHDINAIWGDKQELKGHIAIKKKTLPVIYVFNSDKNSAKRELGQIYAERVIAPDKLEQIARITDECGAREYCENQLQSHIQMANECLNRLGLDESVQTNIVALGEQIVSSTRLDY